MKMKLEVLQTYNYYERCETCENKIISFKKTLSLIFPLNFLDSSVILSLQ